MRKFFDDFLYQHRLKHMETVLNGSEWLANLLRSRHSHAMCCASSIGSWARKIPCLPRYVAGRATARPAFVKAYDDQMAHFAAATQLDTCATNTSPLCDRR